MHGIFTVLLCDPFVVVPSLDPKSIDPHINMNVKADMWCNIGSIHSINNHQFQSKVIISRSRPIHHVILILPVWSGDHIIDINFI